MKHLKKFESSIDERIKYKELLEDFLQDIRDENFDVSVTDGAKSSVRQGRFEIIIKYKINPIYSNDIELIYRDMDKQVHLFNLIKELLQRVKNCGEFDIDFAHFSEQNPRFNLTVRVK